MIYLYGFWSWVIIFNVVVCDMAEEERVASQGMLLDWVSALPINPLNMSQFEQGSSTRPFGA